MKKVKISTWIGTGLIALSLTTASCESSAIQDVQDATQEQGSPFGNQKVGSLGYTELVNLPGKGFYGDLEGNPIDPAVIQANAANKSNVISCPGSGESEFDQQFVSIFSELTCGQGYRFEVKYKVISEFGIVNNISPTLFTFGRIRLKNASGTVIYITPFANRVPVLGIVNNGVVSQNSSGADLHEFIITYRTEYISEAMFNSSASLEPSLFAYTDCANYPTVPIGFSPQQSTFTTQQNFLPCSRVDKVYWGPRNGSTPPFLAGARPLCCGSGCYPNNYVFPNKQEIQFMNSSNQWAYFYLFTQGVNPPSLATSLINHFDVFYIDVAATQTNSGLVPGNVQVRYRNNHMGANSNGGPCVTQPADTWVYETWFIN